MHLCGQPYILKLNIKLISKLIEFYISISDSIFEYYLCVWIHTKLNKLILCYFMLFFIKIGLYDIRFEGWICISTHYLQTIKSILFAELIFNFFKKLIIWYIYIRLCLSNRSTILINFNFVTQLLMSKRELWLWCYTYDASWKEEKCANLHIIKWNIRLV